MEDKFEEQEVFKIRQLISDVNIGMLVTTDDSGKLSSRPMATSQVDEEGNIWFFTNDSENNQESLHNNSVSLIYSHPGKNIYVHINGLTTRILDKEKIDELSNSTLKVWFPNGVDESRLCLLKVNVNEIDFWNTSSRMDAWPSIIRDLF